MPEQDTRPDPEPMRRLLAEYRWPEAALAAAAGMLPSTLWRKWRGIQPYTPADHARLVAACHQFARRLLSL